MAPSTAAQIIITIIPIVGIVAGAVVTMTFLFYNHRHKMLMIEKGNSNRINFDLNEFSLFTGMILLSIGICLTVFFGVKDGSSYSLLSGIIPLSCGSGLLVYFFLRKLLR